MELKQRSSEVDAETSEGEIGRPASLVRVAIPPRESKLLDRVQSGDSEAFAELYREHYPAVYRFIRSRLASGDDSEDLAQETFVQVFRSIGSFARRCSLRTWLFGVARNVCSKHFRTNGRWMVGSHPMVSGAREASTDARVETEIDSKRSLEECFRIVDQQVSERGASIFRLRFAESMSVPAIASATGLSRDAIKMSIRRSRLVISKYANVG